MQDDLFGGQTDVPAPPPAAAKDASAAKTRTATSASEDSEPPRAKPPRRTGVHPAPGLDDLKPLAAALPAQLRLGTSSWSYPGWQGLLWEGAHSEATLAKQGLAVYAQHPLLRTVSIDRGFYRPLTVSEYERYASQVPEDFRFVVKAPSLVTD
ncbi:MAG: DUF72 domain-containing protein, partial [Acidovorax sp.]